MYAHEGSPLPEWAISLSLLAGFWFMLVLDMLSHMLPSATSSSHVPQQQSSGRDDSTYGGDHSLTGHDPAEDHVILLSNIQQRPGTPRRGMQQEVQQYSASSKLSAGGGSNSDVHTLPVLATQDEEEGPAAAAGTMAGSSSSSSGLLARWLSDPSQQALLGLIVHAGGGIYVSISCCMEVGSNSDTCRSGYAALGEILMTAVFQGGDCGGATTWHLQCNAGRFPAGTVPEAVAGLPSCSCCYCTVTSICITVTRRILIDSARCFRCHPLAMVAATVYVIH
eukprot:GHUV01017291.1.p1 GENE.GHUV01017291.1~~GHUV01017291.1.p1  ORF type:complete len:280 (+),score=88.39 GHUV01017291.1:791-1630(+)